LSSVHVRGINQSWPVHASVRLLDYPIVDLIKMNSVSWLSFTPLFTLLVSALVGGLTVWLSLRKRLEEESLGKATRRTTALQLLSDEEFTLEQVRDECVAIDALVDIGRYQHREHLKSESQRIQAEASAMLVEVRARRKDIEARLQDMALAQLESVIALAYHGKRRAESQLRRTQLSRTEVLKAFASAT
jgi:hypothetical protein